jgi:hypothetical protein
MIGLPFGEIASSKDGLGGQCPKTPASTIVNPRAKPPVNKTAM